MKPQTIRIMRLVLQTIALSILHCIYSQYRRTRLAKKEGMWKSYLRLRYVSVVPHIPRAFPSGHIDRRLNNEVNLVIIEAPSIRHILGLAPLL